jgi:hypothetical protein
MSYELSGKVKLVQEPQTFASGFTKRGIVVTVDDGRYPQDIVLEFLQEKVGLLDAVETGQEAKVEFDIRGREHNGRYFNNLVGWNIEIVNVASDTNASEPAPAEQDYPPSWDDIDEDDIPPFG